ncbi:DnaJ domain-containing protein [Haloferax sp. MBLA0076]|uniref:DnaJ domain-containing protein n=1 Tax=Haloferax litoreum TaxID=2666140 RepID=A0A6A8GHD2_9EURY|nr:MULTISPECIES: J domain-containing protein [Haloferax]KAB1193701.1 J domain-containing protein [Haloferax sp. CBA1148]MRX22231.1 DnaJ domain-containing protein [Haloferax litoreum]
MDRDRLVMGLAAVFAGITMLLVVLAFAYRQLLILFVAVPFGATTYFMYSHVSGRLEERFRRTRARASTGRVGFQSERRRASRQTTGGFGAGPRGDPRQGPGAGRFGDGGGQNRRRREYQRVRPPKNAVSKQEALRTLGLDADATAADVKQAYRERVKETHPDSKTGDEEAFKRVTRAYERLSE